MTNQWNVSEAKARFSSILSLAKKEPQIICKHNAPTAVLVDVDRFNETPSPRPTIADLLDELRDIQKDERVEFEAPERVDR